ncbi:MAG: response regulator, partial [Planctomycetota bacterium]|nr:response regulator [Planctomycetota bacterium]
MLTVTRTPEQASHSSSTKNPKLQRILVADDEHLIAAGVADALREMGYEVVGPVGNGEEAIRVAQEQHPDMSLLDIRMPRLDGLAAARQIWDELGSPVVIISAFSDPANVSQCED